MTQEETRESYTKWKTFFDYFLFSVDRRTGSFLHLPFSGGSFEQPVKTMAVLQIMQGVFFEKMEEDIGKIK